ncbi:Meiotically up-regulated 157 protein [Beauveria bassiana]|uniref:Meiotically up-regulated 157 protein n=1 Tax=Beauveria bassiana TaxID=176275 RepID=A0A2N6NQ05_BEABA|nr:Meiotically up-regulated 157 protein [Beauveria bassiana]
MAVSSPRRVACLALGLLASLADATGIASLARQDIQVQRRTAAGCPDYNTYAKQTHPPYSDGPLKLPYMRPSDECRTFKSPAVEKVIEDMKARLENPDLARLFENAFPSTLDTTVKYFDPSVNLAFIITGWLRDTGNQFAHLYKLLPHDENLKNLVKAVINTEARYIYQFPYCGFLKISRSYYENTQDSSFVNENCKSTRIFPG